MIASFPEHRVRLPGGNTASQSDVWAILRAPTGCVSLTVEGKAGETFAQTVGEWRVGASKGKEERLDFLYKRLGLGEAVSDSLRYQLIHRAASALIEAERIGAVAAVMVVVSFVTDKVSRSDYDAFLSCLGGQASPDRLCRTATSAIPLFLGWLDLSPCTDSDLAAISV